MALMMCPDCRRIISNLMVCCPYCTEKKEILSFKKGKIKEAASLQAPGKNTYTKLFTNS